jgi:hypothetical protein
MGTPYQVSFTTAFATDTTGPQVVGISPANGLTQVPINAQLQIQFDKPIQPTSAGQVTLTSNGSPVATNEVFSNGNQTMQLYPTVPLTAGTNYTITVAGIQDIAGFTIAAPVVSSFTTGAGADLIAPQAVTVNPPSGAVGVGTNVVVQVTFNEPIDPLSVALLALCACPTPQPSRYPKTPKIRTLSR